MDKTYKARKEDFVSNLSGGDLHEITLVISVAPAAVLLWSALQSRRSFFVPYRPVAFVADFLLNVAAILFATTAYSSQPVLLNILLLTPAILLTLAPKDKAAKKQPTLPPKQQNGTRNASSTDKPPPPLLLLPPPRPFLTNYRATMMITTCIAILAVDFRIFPRRFAKVENWGTSLMDLGVGSFVFSAGVVSARAILSRSARSQGESRLFQRLVSATRHSVPLFVLGLIRLYSVKGLDYAEHVTEYGVHWNFFFTLAFLPPFVEIFHSLATTVVPSYDILAILLAASYEIILDTTDLTSYILISPRGESLLSKNREGIFSFLGYLAIFLAGRGTGLVVIPEHATTTTTTTTTTNTTTPRSRRRALIRSLAIRTVIWWLLYAISTAPTFRIPPLPTSWDTSSSSSSWSSSIPILDVGLNLSVSRRLANLPYTLWVTAFNSMHLLFFCLIETYYFPSVHLRDDAVSSSSATADDAVVTSRITRAFNKNGLAIFLAANLLTGLVNLSVRTLDAPPLTGMAVLVAYAGAVTAVALGLEAAGWRVKI